MKEYSVGLKYFRPDEEDDAAFLYAVRERLEEKKSELTPDELQQLIEADNFARELLRKHERSSKEGIFYLELLVKKFAFEPVQTTA